MNNNQLSNRLIEKSQEQFLLAVELYNRPTIKYHAESCAMLLCQAWELMLKAAIINRDGEQAIYYKDNTRTISLEDCIKRIFTNAKDPLRHNMQKIVALRNTSTHLIIEEHEFIYGAILQSCVENYADKLQELHNITISDKIPENYLILTTRRSHIEEAQIRAKYDATTAENLIAAYNDIVHDPHSGNKRYAAEYITSLRIVKNEQAADLNVRIVSDAEAGIAIAKQLSDPRNKYPYRMKTILDEVNKKIKTERINFLNHTGQAVSFNQYHFGLFVKFYSFKGDEDYSYDRTIQGEKIRHYAYSTKALNVILNEIRKSPETIIKTLREKIKEE